MNKKPQEILSNKFNKKVGELIKILMYKVNDTDKTEVEKLRSKIYVLNQADTLGLIRLATKPLLEHSEQIISRDEDYLMKMDLPEDADKFMVNLFNIIKQCNKNMSLDERDDVCVIMNEMLICVAEFQLL